MTDWTAFAAALGDIPVITERALVRQKSRDFFWYSPILKEQLNRKSADIVVCPRDEAEVIATVALCARHRVPLTVRGGGTGNYGQAVPLNGGVVMDMMALDRIIALEDGALTVEAGRKLIDIDTATRPMGWELRMHPSTKRTATIGGFIGGGSGGVGSITYGGLRERGNVLSARVISCEETPRIVTLRGDEVAAVNHAYGTTGIITQLTIGMAPVQPFIDILITFDDFMDAARCGLTLATAEGIVKKLVTVVADPVPQSFRGLNVPRGKSVVLAMIARQSLTAFGDVIRIAGGTEIMAQDAVWAETTPDATPLYEYTWNHTTLHMLRGDKGVTYLQCLFPPDRGLDLVAKINADLEGELMQHLEFQRSGGRVVYSALPVIRYTTPERLTAIVAHHEDNGILIANPHFYTLEDGAGHKRVGADQPAMKARMDPHALLNPGKMRTYQAKEA